MSISVSIYVYSWPLNNMGLNRAGPLIHGFFFPINMYCGTLHDLWLVESMELRIWRTNCEDFHLPQGWVPLMPPTCVLNITYIYMCMCVFYITGSIPYMLLYLPSLSKYILNIVSYQNIEINIFIPSWNFFSPPNFCYGKFIFSNAILE